MIKYYLESFTSLETEASISSWAAVKMGTQQVYRSSSPFVKIRCVGEVTMIDQYKE